AAIVALQKVIQASHPVIELGQALDQATDALNAELGAGQGSVDQLKSVVAPADALTAGLSAMLGRPHARLSDNLIAPIDVWARQQTHATKTAASLAAFDESSTLTTVAPRVGALSDADAVLQAETETTPEFKALAAVMTALHTEWAAILTGLKTAA